MTMDRDAAIERMFRASFSYDDIARQLGLTRNQVAGVCHRRGLRRVRKECLAEWTEKRKRAAKPAVVKPVIVIGPEEQAEREQDMRDLDMLADVREGHSLMDVAKHWGVTRSYISRMLRHARAA